MRNRLFSDVFYAVASDSGGGSATDTEETFELLNVDEKSEEILELPKGGSKEAEETGEKEEDTGEEENSEEEVDELKEIEEELKPPKEEDLLEITTPVRRKEILAKYPKLFKDFPYLEKAYYREQQFTELLPTIQDAKLAVEKAQVLDQTERQVMSGDITSILHAAKSENVEAFHKIADNYLPALRHVDEQAYYHVLGNVIKDTIITMVKEGRALGEQGAPLQAAANVLNQFIFGSQTFTPPTQLSKNGGRPDSREEEYKKQDQQRAYQQFESVRSDLQTKADNVLKSTIDGHLDPQGTMTNFVKTHAAKEAFDNLETLISKDTRFRTLLDKLWEKAFESKFDKTSTDRIKAAYLSKAKTLLPSVIKKARNDALKGMGRRERVEESTNGDNEAAIKSPKVNTNQGKSTPPSSGRIRSAKDIPRGMTTLEFLNKD